MRLDGRGQGPFGTIEVSRKPLADGFGYQAGELMRIKCHLLAPLLEPAPAWTRVHPCAKKRLRRLERVSEGEVVRSSALVAPVWLRAARHSAGCCMFRALVGR